MSRGRMCRRKKKQGSYPWKECERRFRALSGARRVPISSIKDQVGFAKTEKFLTLLETKKSQAIVTKMTRLSNSPKEFVAFWLWLTSQPSLKEASRKLSEGESAAAGELALV